MVKRGKQFNNEQINFWAVLFAAIIAGFILGSFSSDQVSQSPKFNNTGFDLEQIENRTQNGYDVTVEYIYTNNQNISVGENVTFLFGIKNIGNRNSPPGTAAFFDGFSLFNHNVPSLVPGKFYTYNVSRAYQSRGEYKLSIDLLTSSYPNDINLRNNKKTTTITVN